MRIGIHKIYLNLARIKASYTWSLPLSVLISSLLQLFKLLCFVIVFKLDKGSSLNYSASTQVLDWVKPLICITQRNLSNVSLSRILCEIKSKLKYSWSVQQKTISVSVFTSSAYSNSVTNSSWPSSRALL